MRFTVVLPFILIVNSAQAWYPYSDRYNAWQATWPFMIGALHNSVPEDRLPDRIARMRAAGINTFCWSKPCNAMPFYRAAHQGGMAWAAWLRPGSTDILDDLAKIPGNSYIQIGDEPGEEYFHGGEYEARSQPR